MKTHILTVFLGLAAGLAFAFSCSGDDASGADAQTACDCDPAEPPLAGRIQQFESDPTTVVAGNAASNDASCPSPDSIALGGGCYQTDTDITGTDLVIQDSGNPVQPTIPTWACVWKNNGTVDATAVAFVICLTPAPSN